MRATVYHKARAVDIEVGPNDTEETIEMRLFVLTRDWPTSAIERQATARRLLNAYRSQDSFEGLAFTIRFVA